jgi:hypothetical protein
MEQTMIVTTPAVTALMFAKDLNPAFPPSATTALWATAVWGTKPAQDRNTPLELPPVWDPNAARALRTRNRTALTISPKAATAAFLLEAFKTALYGDNSERRDRYTAG